MENDNASQPSPTEIGNWLTSAREEKQLTIKQVMAELRLDAQTVEAIEAGTYEGIPSVYLRGYLRNYARLLKIDEAALLEAASPFLTDSTATKPFVNYSGQDDIINMHDRRMHIATAVIAATFASLFFLYWWQEKREIIPAPAELPQAPAPLTENIETADPIDNTSFIDEGDSIEAFEEVNETHADAPYSFGDDSPLEAVVGTPTDADEITVPTDESPVMEIQLDDECWIEVVDGRGERLLTKMGQPGEHIVLTGEPPLSVLLGNASAAVIYYAEEPYDITPHSRGNVARFHLGE